jgi:AcrR family transcriptional regulator
MPTKTDPITGNRMRLTRERVVDAALRIMDTEGLEAVSMRRVGRELGVEAMSLYHHVHDKEDLLDGIAQLVMSEFRLPEDTSDWMEAGRAAAREWRRLLKAHPEVIQVFAERHKPLDSVVALQPMDFALDCLRRAGLAPKQAAEAFNAFGGYIFGFVLMETRSMFGGPDLADHMDADQLRRLIPADQLPNVAECFPAVCTVGSDEQFEFGLDLLLTGVASKLAGRDR